MSEPLPPTAVLLFRRKFRNYLLDARFQLKFAGFFILLTALVAIWIGIFLVRTTDALFVQMNASVESRRMAAEASRELGTCSLNNELASHLDDPEFTRLLEARSKAIDAKFEQDQQAVILQRVEIERQQSNTMWVLIVFLGVFLLTVGVFSIALTHRVVGPLFRLKRMTREVAGGTFSLPTYGLRPGDELKDFFELFVEMIRQLRTRTEEDLVGVKAGLVGDKAALEQLQGRLEERLKKPPPFVPKP